MSIVYQQLAKAIALRCNQLVDAIDAAALETNYTGVLSAIMGGVEVPYSALRRDILAVEAEIATMIGLSSNTQLRMALMDEAGVSSGDDIPTVGDNGGKFVGKFDGIFREDTDMMLSLMPSHVVQRRIKNAGGYFDPVDLDGYCVEGTKVFFYCGGQDAYFRGCAWKKSHAESQYDLAAEAGVSVLPQQCELLWQNKVLANIAQENWFTSEAAGFGSAAEDNARDIGLLPEPVMQDDLVATTKENRNAESKG